MVFLTEKGDFFVLKHSGDKDELKTLVHANVNSADCQPNRTCQLISIDTSNQFIAIHVSIGVIQLISYEIIGTEINFKKSFPLKVIELEIVDISFIDQVRSDSTAATLAILHRLPMKLSRVKTYELVKSGNTFTLSNLNYSMSDLDPETNRIVRVPSPRGGFLVLSSERIIYSNPVTNIYRKLVFTPTYFTAVASVDSDGFRFILGSTSGDFFILLLLASAEGIVSEIKFEKLGRTTIASCLTYIDDGYVYVGSQHGDSQLIQLSTERVVTDTKDVQFLRVVHTFPSLAPLNDFSLIRANGMSDQNILIGASGSSKDGAIKIVSSGIEAVTVMSADMESFENLEDKKDRCSIVPSAIFSFRAGRPGDSLNHTHLAISSLGQTSTHFVDPIAGSLEEVAWGLNSTTETLNLFQLDSGHLPQVTSSGIYLGYSGSISCGGMWNCKPSERIILSDSFENYVLLALSDFCVRLFHVTPSGFTVVASVQFSSEISCMKLFKARDNSLMAAISFWDMKSFGFISFNSKEKSAKFIRIDHSFVKYSVIRSAQILKSHDDNLFALFGGGNGQVLICKAPNNSETPISLESICLMRLGSNPVKIFSFDDLSHVIAQSDRPYYITWHANTQKLICSVINIPNFDTMAQFNFGDQAGFVTMRGRELSFSYVQQSYIPKVNIRSILIGKSIYRLIHIPHSRMFAAILHNFPIAVVPMSHWPLLRSELVLINDETYEIIDRYELQSSLNDEKRSLGSECFGNLGGRFTEIGWSIASGELEGLVNGTGIQIDENNQKTISNQVLVLGTSLTNDDPKNEKGRILVFQIGEGNLLRLISSNEMKGGVRCVTICKGFVIGCVRGLNIVYKWDYQIEKKLVKASSSGGHIDGTCISQLDNILCIGDSLTSVSFCHLNKDNLLISEIARDFQDNYITTLQMINHSSALAADLAGNLMTYQIIRDEPLDLNVSTCEGNIHLGDQINKILPGDFRMHPKTSQKSFILVSSTGAIYALHQIQTDLYKKLFQLQKNLVGLLKPVGGIKHGEFRRFFNGERTMKSSQGFIDGDLLSRFMGLNQAAKNEALGILPKSSTSENVGFSQTEIINIIESLSYGI